MDGGPRRHRRCGLRHRTLSTRSAADGRRAPLAACKGNVSAGKGPNSTATYYWIRYISEQGQDVGVDFAAGSTGAATRNESTADDVRTINAGNRHPADATPATIRLPARSSCERAGSLVCVSPPFGAPVQRASTSRGSMGALETPQSVRRALSNPRIAPIPSQMPCT